MSQSKRKFQKKWTLLFSVAFSISLWAQVKPSRPPSRTLSSDKPLRIGVTLPRRADPYFLELERGLREGASEMGYELTVLDAEVLTEASEGDLRRRQLERQRWQIEGFITEGVDALVVTPVDSEGVGQQIVKANRAGIPVFTVDIDCSSKEVKVARHIASNNKEGGRMAGEAMILALRGKGEVAILGLRGITSVENRMRGFKQALKRAPGIQLVKELETTGRRENGHDVMLGLISDYPHVRGVFGVNDQTALGAFDALRERPRDSLVLIGYDCSDEAREYIQERTQFYASVLQYPRLMGKKTIQAIFEQFHGAVSSRPLLTAVSLCSRHPKLRRKPR